LQDLYDRIAKGDYPSWTMYLQVMPYAEAHKAEKNPFDLTKTWSHKDYPLIEIGRFTLNRNPENYFSDVEQAAYDPSNFIPGIETSPDKVLQGRLLSYVDAHRHRLGTNYEQLPINMACNAKVTNFQKDGPARIYNQGGAPNYWPNSFGYAAPDPAYKTHEPKTDSGEVGLPARYNDDDADNFSECRVMYTKVSLHVYPVTVTK
jgi:catalase